VIDEILTVLKDGNWHDLHEIAKKCSTNELRLKIITSFLSEYDFIKLDKKGRKAKLHSLMLEFINEIQPVTIGETVNS
jgi:predicted transcriptional regulator